MRIIPVLDVLDGITVHAVRGRRKKYKPLRSVICELADPLEVATAFKDLGFSEIYLADLNAIMGNRDNSAIIKQISAKTGLQLMVDAGVSSIEKARKAVKCGASNIVIGTETLTDICFIEDAVRSLGADRVTVSLDMKDGVVLRGFGGEEVPDPFDLLLEFQKMGINQVILLDLARVGSEEGVDSAFLKEAMFKVDLKVFVGGGVRNMDDIVGLNDLGVSGVLLATALHSGKVTTEDLAKAGLMVT